jgi:hypothetical protein
MQRVYDGHTYSTQASAGSKRGRVARFGLVVWLAVASLLTVVVPHAYSVPQARMEPQRVALPAQEPGGDICRAQNPDME